MKKLIPILFALVLILVLLPANEARAEYHYGDTCPGCGRTHAIGFGHTDAGHFPYCPYCAWNISTDVVPVEPHSGTSSTCTEQPLCSVCAWYYGDPPGHSFTNYASDGNATCTADGTKTAKCDRCDVTDTQPDTGSALGHSFTNYVSDGNATCTADGTKTAKCDRCDVTDTQPDTGSALGHSFTNYASDGNATCTADGTKTARCDRCDVTDTQPDTGSALGHNPVKTAKVEPTCTDAGTEEYWTCSLCKKLFSDEACTKEISAPDPIPAVADAHKPGKAVQENVDISCTREGGYDEVVYCSICKKELSRKHVTVKPTGHDWQPYEYHVTITRFYYICKNCGRTQWIHNKDSLNMKPGLVRYANGESVDYKASATGPDDDGMLTIMPIKHTERDNTDDISLYLTPDDVYVWVWEKMNRIELVRDRVVLAIDPREITPAMFGLENEKEVDLYVFTLTPEGKDGWLVRAEALSGITKIPAQELKGITLTAAGKETAITANGVYKAE